MEVTVIVNANAIVIAHINPEFHCSAVRVVDRVSHLTIVDTLIVDSISISGVFSEIATALADVGRQDISNAILEVSCS